MQAQQAAVRAQQRQQKQQHVLLLQQALTQQRQAAGMRHCFPRWQDMMVVHPQEHALKYNRSICVTRHSNALLSKQLFSVPLGMLTIGNTSNTRLCTPCTYQAHHDPERNHIMIVVTLHPSHTQAGHSPMSRRLCVVQLVSNAHGRHITAVHKGQAGWLQ